MPHNHQTSLDKAISKISDSRLNTLRNLMEKHPKDLMVIRNALTKMVDDRISSFVSQAFSSSDIPELMAMEEFVRETIHIGKEDDAIVVPEPIVVPETTITPDVVAEPLAEVTEQVASKMAHKIASIRRNIKRIPF